MYIKKILFIFVLLLTLSCSSFSKYLVEKGEVKVSTGRIHNKEFNTNWIIKRRSWYKELNLYLDFLHAPINKKIEIYKWLSKKEKALFKNLKCTKYGILFYFISSNELIKEYDFLLQLKKHGIELYSANDIKKYLIGHPNLEYLNLDNYKFKLYCQKNYLSKINLKLKFAGFFDQSISF